MKKIECDYDNKNRCNNCKHKQQCTLTINMTEDLQETQNKIAELIDEINKLKEDIKEWRKIDRQIKAGYYTGMKNIRGDWIDTPSDVINIPTISFLLSELEDKRIVLRLYQSKEIELIKKNME